MMEPKGQVGYMCFAQDLAYPRRSRHIYHKVCGGKRINDK